LLGFVFSAFRADDFFQGIVSSASHENIEFTIYDGTDLTPENLLHRSTGPNDSAAANYQPRFAAFTNMNVAGRPWTISYSSRPAFDLALSRSGIPYSLVAGILISFLFFSVTRS